MTSKWQETLTLEGIDPGYEASKGSLQFTEQT